MFLFYLLLLPVWLVQLGFRYGMILFIVSEVMSFLTFFWVPSSLGNLPLEGLQFKHDFLSYLAIQNIVHMLSFPIL
jgi:heme/copper-type cytochrome/quinol oxidase subunit 3